MMIFRYATINIPLQCYLTYFPPKMFIFNAILHMFRWYIRGGKRRVLFLKEYFDKGAKSPASKRMSRSAHKSEVTRMLCCAQEQQHSSRLISLLVLFVYLDAGSGCEDIQSNAMHDHILSVLGGHRRCWLCVAVAPAAPSCKP